MKFPESWLREHVTIDATRDELVARLTAIGLEVENVEAIGGALTEWSSRKIISCANTRKPTPTGLPSVDRPRRARANRLRRADTRAPA